MKITKNKVTACDTINETCDEVTNIPQEVTEIPDDLSVISNYDAARSDIMNAINALSNFGNQDPKAREAIANLSVIYFDLE